MGEGADQEHEGVVDDGAASDEEQHKRGRGGQQQPTLYGAQGHAAERGSPVGVVVLFQEEDPHDHGHGDTYQRGGLHQNPQNQLQYEEYRIVGLKVVDIRGDPGAPIARRRDGHRQEEVLPWLRLAEKPPRLLLDWVQGCRHRGACHIADGAANNILGGSELASHEGACRGAEGCCRDTNCLRSCTAAALCPGSSGLAPAVHDRESIDRIAERRRLRLQVHHAGRNSRGGAAQEALEFFIEVQVLEITVLHGRHLSPAPRLGPPI
mmetsp:Transcript_41010/g.117849  ORF Transcript_41010/g.117849 Transcript_41010/m.117849 type:complete len:265 (-) Transcript_41010:104-898(-)